MFSAHTGGIHAWNVCLCVHAGACVIVYMCAHTHAHAGCDVCTTLPHHASVPHLLGSLKLMTGFWRFRSHTTVVPLVEEDAKMCCTLRFHAM